MFSITTDLGTIVTDNDYFTEACNYCGECYCLKYRSPNKFFQTVTDLMLSGF